MVVSVFAQVDDSQCGPSLEAGQSQKCKGNLETDKRQAQIVGERRV